MSSLADLPEVIGFFSYSRDDDESYKGRLSALREAIQHELSAQLGRSKATFRLWQDKEAIAPGRLWETEIKAAVEQSVFFIPIVTPRMVNSKYCQFEFDAFLARERALNRTDLVFPILYVPVPGLENEALWRDHPVLSPIARRQYVDWQTFRYVDVHTPAMREEIAHFCRKIVEALNLRWLSPEERRRHEEAEAQARAEDQRRRQEAEAKRHSEDEVRRQRNEAEAQRLAEERQEQEAEAEGRAQEEERRKREEAEARQRAEQLRRAREVEAKQRGDEDKAFAAAKAADTVQALDGFIAAYPESHRAAEAKDLYTALAKREAAYHGAVSSDDPAAPRVYLQTYPVGSLADDVRKSIRSEGRNHLQSGAIPLLGISVVILLLIFLGVYFVWNSLPQRPMLTIKAGLVNSIAFSPDSQSLASGAEDNSVKIWNTLTGQLGLTLRHSAPVTAVAFSPDGKLIASGGGKTVKLWDAGTGELVNNLDTEELEALAFSPDGEWIASGSGYDSKIWDVGSGQLLRTLAGSSYSVAFSADGTRIAAAGHDQTIKLWNARTGQSLDSIGGFDNTVWNVAFSPDGKWLASGDNNGSIKIWDAISSQPVSTLSSSLRSVWSVAFSPDSKWLASASYDRTVRIWAASNWKPLRTISTFDDEVHRVAFSPDGKLVASANDTGFDTINIWHTINF